MRNDETSEVLNVNLPPKDVFNQLIEYFGDKFIKQKVPFSHIEGRWACGPFKIDINPSNGKSQVKFNFSCLCMKLFALIWIIAFNIGLFMMLNPSTLNWGISLNASGLAFGIGSLITSQRMKRNIMKRLKELFKT